MPYCKRCDAEILEFIDIFLTDNGSGRVIEGIFYNKALAYNKNLDYSIVEIDTTSENFANKKIDKQFFVYSCKYLFAIDDPKNWN